MMIRRDIIVIGASAGGVEALKQLVSALPPRFECSIFVVLHIQRTFSLLPQILSSAGHLTATHPGDGERIKPGHIYIAPPDRHLLVQPGHVHLSKGPKENRNRPAADPLFRSAALAYGPRVVGVVLTGMLDDGTLGLWEIKRHGGIAIVQDPLDALFSQMPKSALASVKVDHIVRLAEMGPLLVSLCHEPLHDRDIPKELEMSREHTRFTCPDCHGPLDRIHHGSDVTEFRCRVGHSYMQKGLVEAHAEAEERALWSAIEHLEESADLADETALTVPPEEGQGWRAQADKKRALARTIREMVTKDDSELVEMSSDQPSAK
jgi:two-component system chemotaxis response regulator CheB